MLEGALSIAYGLLLFVLFVVAIALLVVMVAGFLRWCADLWREFLAWWRSR